MLNENDRSYLPDEVSGEAIREIFGNTPDLTAGLQSLRQDIDASDLRWDAAFTELDSMLAELRSIGEASEQ
ncbi:hypothetical protein HY772_10210 [Candidatus Woesearchaeota archaeon]|nr:hypothetical protein [Candidatus Woesearchaeota archaeon]